MASNKKKYIHEWTVLPFFYPLCHEGGRLLDYPDNLREAEAVSVFFLCISSHPQSPAGTISVTWHLAYGTLFCYLATKYRLNLHNVYQRLKKSM